MTLPRFLTVGLVILIAGSLAPSARAGILLQDHFDDGGALPGDAGSPFKAMRSQSDVSMADSTPRIADNQLVLSVDNQSNGNNGAALESKDRFNFASQPISIEFSVGDFTDTGDDSHVASVYWALTTEGTQIDVSKNDDVIYLYYNVNGSMILTSTNNDVDNALGTVTGVGGTGDFSVRLDLDATHYALYIDGNQKLTGLHGLDDSAFNTAGGGLLRMWQRSSSSLTYDSVEISTVPEPASLALVALGGLVMVSRRRRGRE